MDDEGNYRFWIGHKCPDQVLDIRLEGIKDRRFCRRRILEVVGTDVIEAECTGSYYATLKYKLGKSVNGVPSQLAIKIDKDTRAFRYYHVYQFRNIDIDWDND